MNLFIFLIFELCLLKKCFEQCNRGLHLHENKNCKMKIVMKYNPEIHHRRSIRLKNYDYSEDGYYFVNICTQNRQNYFQDSGVIEMIEKWWHLLPNKFENVEIDEFIVMPDHVHGIIVIINSVGADLCVRPNVKCDEYIVGKHIGLPLHPPLQEIVQWFKTMTTNEYIRNVKNLKWKPFDGKLWQRNYYEHIIRNEKALCRIRQYIKNNLLEHLYKKNKGNI